MKAVILLSGGIDSSTTLYIARRQGYQCYCLIVNYNQRHDKEIKSAVTIAAGAGCLEVKKIDIHLPWQGSALLDKNIPVPVKRDIDQMSADIPDTYVPARNIIFLSLAFSWAEVLDAQAVFIGANAIDYSGYPDCCPEFYQAFDRVIAKGTKAGVEGKKIKIETPLINWTKARIITEGIKLGVPYEATWSCYKGGQKPCHECDSCLLRERGFKEAGIEDPLVKK
ncbi:MAG: 7-cyano-7-deazaguanine synthase QueC [Candidatus Omnitrophica bacterium]|nr:7-cyano-7-deazaguanine synthase QueC [Candidatus Omnitrophota bacterium]